MRIKENNKQSQILIKIKSCKSYKIIFGLLSLIIYSIALILFSGILYKEGFFGEILKPIIQENVKLPINYFKGLLSNPEHIFIDIKHKDYERIAYKREIALREGVLHVSDEDFVPAKIRWNGKTVGVKMRLKGDLADHWARDDKWSLRIKSTDGNTILGMHKFSLQHPRTRGFMNDWFLHAMLKHLGFITLRYDFINVTINGKDQGIYLLEEHFEDMLLENNKHVSAPIIRIKDHLLWYLVDPNTGFTNDKLDEMFSSSPIDAFNTNSVNRDETMLNNFNIAKNLLESFRREELLTHEVFDVDKLAKIFAVIDLLGYHHTTAYSNLRFYYDPFTSLLVPIGYDNTFIYEAKSIQGQTKNILFSPSEKSEHLDWIDLFFKDKIFFEMYIEALKEISDKSFLDKFFNETTKAYEEKLGQLYGNFPGYSFDKEKVLLYKNQEVINKILNPLEGIQAYFFKFDKENNQLTLQMGNIQFLPIEILSLSYNNLEFPLIGNEVILQSKKPFKPIDFQKIQFQFPEQVAWMDNMATNLKVNYRIIGTKNIKNISVFLWSYLDDDFIETDFIRQQPNYKDFDFLIVDEKSSKIFIKSGEWDLNTNIIIPKGFTVVCGEGTRINLINSAKILSYSPIEFNGTGEKPIYIYSNDSTGEGIVVLNTGGKSIISNVIFKNLSPPSQAGWKMPSAVIFYESPVDISSSHFIDMRSGVGLSLIRSEFTLDKSYFNKIDSDAINIVFGKGSITKTSFTDNGHDAMYVKGSVIEAENIYIEKTVNIALNFSENSRVRMKNVEIHSANIAVKGRDKADVNLENLSILKCDQGFNIFQGKLELGPAVIIVKTIKQEEVNKPYQVEKQSLLMIDGKKI